MECFGRGQKDAYCSIRLLDETELTVNVQRNTRGSELLNQVFDKLNLLEKDYFGLRFLDSQDQTHWLDPVKAIGKQIKNGPPFILYFGVKFYMENPCKLKEEVTRYQFFLQLRMDMLQGRLPCPFHATAELCAYATQSELGDYDPSQHSVGYISEFRFIPNQTEELEQQITQLHQKLKGMEPAKAEVSFLERARWLDMYGVDLHPVLGHNGVEFYLGLTPSGVVVYKNKAKVARYFWPRIAKVHFKDTEFSLVVLDKDGVEDECIFRLASRSACKHLWKCCVEQHAFFRLPKAGEESPHQRKLSFTKSSFRHIGRTQREALEAASTLNRPEQQVIRAPSRKYHRRPSQTDISLKNGMASDDMCLDSSPSSPNGVILRLSPQPACRLPSHHGLSGRESPTSGVSTRSVPWEDCQQARVGLFTPAGGSPVSVRSSASRQHRHRGRSKSPGPHHRHGDRSDCESEAAYGSRRRSRRSAGLDAGSDHESRHHHQHRKRRSRSRGVSSGSESEYSRQDEGRRHQRRSRERMVSSEDQWHAVEENKLVRGELREGQEVVVKRLKDGALANNLKHMEFQKHIKKDLVDQAQYTEEERSGIPYTDVVLDSGPVNSSNPIRDSHSRTRSKRNEDFSDSNISEHSTRHQSRNTSSKSHQHIRKMKKSQAPTQPDGTPPPPYSHSHIGDPVHTSRDPPLDSRGESGSRGVTVQNGDAVDGKYSGHLTPGGGLFGRHQPGSHQDLPLTNGHQGHDRHPHRLPQANGLHSQQVSSSPTLGMEGLCVAHSREDSGLGNEQEEGLTDRQTLPRRDGQPQGAVRSLRREMDSQRSRSDPIPSAEVCDLRTTLQLTVNGRPGPRPDKQQASRLGMQGYRVVQLHSGGHAINDVTTKQEDSRRGPTTNGGPDYPTKLRPAPAIAYGQSTIPGLGPAPKLAPITINNNNIEVTSEKEVSHLWSEPIRPSHAVVTSSLVDDQDMRVNRDKAGNREDSISEQLPDFPPGYKPNYNRGLIAQL
ncbi:band 4.1-like protein 4 isoform X2 [Acanthaster planci]|uniref:Erythrocyte membrane protein band 4.1-like 4A n=1 Tax=Acanthaster planci TaxID=133434 RepID=A0A8B7ZJE4_ACAPL|nr:band 4.1-like protein 4 isoform X2 [Acanthaster planci]